MRACVASDRRAGGGGGRDQPTGEREAGEVFDDKGASGRGLLTHITIGRSGRRMWLSSFGHARTGGSLPACLRKKGEDQLWRARGRD